MTKKTYAIAFIVTVTLACIVSGITINMLLDFTKSDALHTSSYLNVTTGSKENILLSQVNKSDRIYLVLNTSSDAIIEAESTNAFEQLPFDVEGLPFEYEDWIMYQQRFLFIAKESVHSNLSVTFGNPQIPYAVKIFEGIANYSLSNYVDGNSVNYIEVHVQAPTNQNSQFQQIMLFYPYNQIANQNFQINGSLKLIAGKIGYVNLILRTRDRVWFAYKLASETAITVEKTVDFTMNLYNQSIFGPTFSEHLGKQIQYVAISIGLNSSQWTGKEGYARIGIGEIKIENGDKTTIISPDVSENHQVRYDLYIFHKFSPTQAYTDSILTLAFLVVIGALILAPLTDTKLKFQRFFKPLITSEAESNPEPDTYLAKLFHKPRYDQLAMLISECTRKKINTLIDVGCGKGIFQKSLTQKGITVTHYIGCDINVKALRENKDMERVMCDIQCLPFKPQVAEIVICSEVFEHIPTPQTGFREILDVSKHWVFISFPDEKLKNALGFRYPEHISELDDAEFERVAKEKNFRLFRKEKLYFAFPPSVFDKSKLSYTAFYRPVIDFLFELLSKIIHNFSLIKTVMLVFERKTESAK
jgi:SAM-dependent methyltransferase